MARTPWKPLFLIAACGLLSGCAHWSNRLPSDDLVESSESALPPLRVAGETVSLEVAHTIVPEDLRDEYLATWREIDETTLDESLRRSLRDNGLRLGRVSGPLPGGLRKLLDQSLDPLAADRGTGFDSLKMHRIQMAYGREKELNVGSERAQLNVLRKENGAIRGRTLDDAQCRLTLRAESEVDGARLLIQPWIVHGPVKQSFSGEGGAWRISPERPREDFPELRIQMPLAPGETLILAPTEPLQGVGKLFFGESPKTPRLLLMRLASSKANDLFDDGEDDLAPISSLGE